MKNTAPGVTTAVNSETEIGTEKGKLIASDGQRYRGEFRDGLFHGTGRLSNGGHQIYSGQWRNGLPHGSGKYRYPAGHIYDEAWKAGCVTARARTHMPMARRSVAPGDTA
ncbi:MAG: hypothetical protein GY789_26490 [Hyphomicrobiales bacterium]|nr:hypothetical protein [Hyphomicrobiales bacterium]MCP5000472.1 hypothetical protein [Hyphomicrobiales bacterium]